MARQPLLSSVAWINGSFDLTVPVSHLHKHKKHYAAFICKDARAAVRFSKVSLGTGAGSKAFDYLTVTETDTSLRQCADENSPEAIAARKKAAREWIDNWRASQK